MINTKPVIIREQDCETEDWSKLGKNFTTWKTLISGDRTPTNSVTMGIAEIKPGGTQKTYTCTVMKQPKHIT
jgi:hypothetical protein